MHNGVSPFFLKCLLDEGLFCASIKVQPLLPGFGNISVFSYFQVKQFFQGVRVHSKFSGTCISVFMSLRPDRSIQTLQQEW